MIDWRTVFLGVIAFATLSTAIVQIAVILGLARLARRIEQLVDRVEHEITPLVAQLTSIGKDASRAAALATAQIERLDQVFTDVAKRFDDMVRVGHGLVTGPVGRGMALATAGRAVFRLLRDRRARRARASADDDDPLFI